MQVDKGGTIGFSAERSCTPSYHGEGRSNIQISHFQKRRKSRDQTFPDLSSEESKASRRTGALQKDILDLVKGGPSKTEREIEPRKIGKYNLPFTKLSTKTGGGGGIRPC